LVLALAKRTKLMFMIAPSGAARGGSQESRSGSIEELFSAAIKARLSAYAPYSGFAVGAAVRTDSGTISTGANVENAAFPVGICAEAAAIAAMVVAGERRIAEILIVAEGDALVTPCGACRQRIHEFAEADAKIYVAGIMGVRAIFTQGTLLPAAFGRGMTKAAKS
jgi:cytidine deaminase